MSKIMIAPPLCFSPNAIHDRWVLLLNFLEKELGFTYNKSTVHGDKDGRNLCTVELPDGTDIVFLLITPRLVNSDSLLNSINGDKKAKLISYIFDTHRNNEYFERLLERSDMILSWTNENFRERWPQFIDKFVHFPAYFSPDARFTKFTMNEEPIMRCLLAGAVSSAYPLREYLLGRSKDKDKEAVDVLPFPGTFGVCKKYAVTRDAFAEKLHSYFCGITSSVFTVVIVKAVEIPAVGSLLLMDRTKDSDTMGFVPFKHYIPIDQKSAMGWINECLANPEKYKKVRLDGMEFVRREHGVDKRMEQLRTLIGKVKSCQSKQS